MFTMLLPTRIVESSRLLSSDIFITRMAFLLPSEARFFILVWLNEVNAISLAEKNAEKASQICIKISLGKLSLGMMTLKNKMYFRLLG